ncbi:D-alanyl-D-alanine carboxypeptidase family protein [Bacillus sp. OTU530]|uniref:D-alanyl-D-alanine carboxypeptidase family protein n=1 Tax=Bacillus sp. OTU530 TaxID=3043862 RepID=UPI00313E0DC5
MKRAKIYTMLLTAVLVFLSVPSRYYANTEQPQPDVVGKYAVSIDAKTGDVLYDKNANAQAYPASITKVLTAILLMEHVAPGEQIGFSQTALNQDKSNYQIEFQPGETIDRDTALMILMVLSANDVAVAIAEHIAGSTEAFSKLMNEKAVELGAKNSHFVTPNGLHDPAHITTPYDMAMITRGALKYPEILKAMSTKQTTVTTSRQTASIFNKATFFELPNFIAGKTGFTDQARHTLILINQKDNMEIINVVMSSRRPDIYNDMNVIANYAFNSFEKQTVLDKAKWSKQEKLLDKSVHMELERGSELLLKRGEGKRVQANFEPLQFNDEKLYKDGIHKGEVLGQVRVMKNGNVLDTVNVLSKDDVAYEKPEPKKPLTFSIEAAALGLLALCSLAFVVWKVRRRVKERAM